MTRRSLRNLLIPISVVLGSLLCAAQPAPPRRPGAPPPDPRVATQEEAAGAVQRAYDGISRAAMLQASSNAGVNISSLISQSKGAYQEALSRYQANDYPGAREEAMASTDLSRAAEELAASGNASNERAGVPAPPASSATREDSMRARRDVQNLGYRLGVVSQPQSSSETAPANVASQAKALLSTSETLLKEAQAALSQNQAQRAIHLAHAGDALTHVAEHLQNRYLIAAGITPTAPAPPPSDPDGAAPPPPPGGGRQ